MTAPTRPPPSSQALAWATVAWRKHLGEPHVVLDRDVVDPAEIATFATEHRVAAILRPGRRAEVQACLRVATAHEVPVYPVSRGANWGYGSRVPTSHGAVLLDLSRMERVVDVDLVLGTLTVEPGVTFADVEERLRGTGWMLPSPGSSPGASVVGNTVDGGVCDGLVPLRRRAVLEVEVVTPDGEVLRTGLGAFPDARARGAHPGVGPDLTGLFLQSNLGVVTRMTIALQRVPPRQAAVHLQLYDDARLPGLVDAVRIVLRDGLIEGSVTFYDEIRLLAMTTRYPYGEVGGATPLPEAWLAEVREALGGSRWIVEASVRSTDGARLDSARRTLIEALTPWADRVDFAADAPTPQFTPELRPTVETAYWRKRALPDAGDLHPDRDRCGVIWVPLASRLEGERVAVLIATLRPVYAEYGFEAAFSIRTLDERAAVVLAAILFDRDAPGEDARALDCHRALVARATATGALVTRPTVLDGPNLDADRGAVALIRRLKQALDPADVLAPGRWDLRGSWRD